MLLGLEGQLVRRSLALHSAANHDAVVVDGLQTQLYLLSSHYWQHAELSGPFTSTWPLHSNMYEINANHISTALGMLASSCCMSLPSAYVLSSLLHLTVVGALVQI